jgi:hypothetical protein
MPLLQHIARHRSTNLRNKTTFVHSEVSRNDLPTRLVRMGHQFQFHDPRPLSIPIRLFMRKDPSTTPMVFSGARRFVEQHGVEVWSELCDTVMPDDWFNIKITAAQLDCIKHYAKPERYLQAVLKAVMADYAERPEDYGLRPPVQVRGMRMIEAKV